MARDATPEQYKRFGAAVAGVMDAHLSMGGEHPERVVQGILMMAEKYGIEF